MSRAARVLGDWTEEEKITILASYDIAVTKDLPPTSIACICVGRHHGRCVKTNSIHAAAAKLWRTYRSEESRDQKEISIAGTSCLGRLPAEMQQSISERRNYLEQNVLTNSDFQRKPKRPQSQLCKKKLQHQSNLKNQPNTKLSVIDKTASPKRALPNADGDEHGLPKRPKYGPNPKTNFMVLISDGPKHPLATDGTFPVKRTSISNGEEESSCLKITSPSASRVSASERQPKLPTNADVIVSSTVDDAYEESGAISTRPGLEDDHVPPEERVASSPSVKRATQDAAASKREANDARYSDTRDPKRPSYEQSSGSDINSNPTSAVLLEPVDSEARPAVQNALEGSVRSSEDIDELLKRPQGPQRLCVIFDDLMAKLEKSEEAQAEYGRENLRFKANIHGNEGKKTILDLKKKLHSERTSNARAVECRGLIDPAKRRHKQPHRDEIRKRWANLKRCVEDEVCGVDNDPQIDTSSSSLGPGFWYKAKGALGYRQSYPPSTFWNKIRSDINKLECGITVRCFVTAALCESVFNSDYPNFGHPATPSEKALCEAISSTSGKEALMSLMVGARSKLVEKEREFKHRLKLRADILAAKLYDDLAPIFQEGTQASYVNIFFEALDFKTQLLLSSHTFEAYRPCQRASFNPKTMRAENMDGIEINPQSVGAKATVAHCLFPALYEHPASESGVAPYRNFVRSTDYRHIERATLLEKATVLIQESND